MAIGKQRMRRHSRYGRHLLRVIRRSKHASIQDTAVTELTHEIDRRHGRRGLGSRTVSATPDVWRPLTSRARKLITQLRKTKVWKLQKQLVRELANELKNGKRAIDRARERAAAFGQRASRVAGILGRGARFAGQRARALGQRTAKTWRTVRPHAARAAGRLTRRVRQWRQQRRNRTPAPRPAVRARPAPTAAIPRYPAPARTRTRRPRPARPAARTR